MMAYAMSSVTGYHDRGAGVRLHHKTTPRTQDAASSMPVYPTSGAIAVPLVWVASRCAVLAHESGRSTSTTLLGVRVRMNINVKIVRKPLLDVRTGCTFSSVSRVAQWGCWAIDEITAHATFRTQGAACPPCLAVLRTVTCETAVPVLSLSIPIYPNLSGTTACSSMSVITL
jgi:hypothetical protein